MENAVAARLQQRVPPGRSGDKAGAAAAWTLATLPAQLWHPLRDVLGAGPLLVLLPPSAVVALARAMPVFAVHVAAGVLRVLPDAAHWVTPAAFAGVGAAALALDLQLARQLVSAYVAGDEALPPVVALTTCFDGAPLQYLAARLDAAGDKENGLRGTLLDLQNTAAPIAARAPHMHAMLQRWTSANGPAERDSHAFFARYEVFGTFSVKGELPPSSTVTVEAVWRGSRPTAVISAPPSSADVTLVVRDVAREADPDAHAGTRSLAAELAKIDELEDKLAEMKSQEDPSVVVPLGGGGLFVSEIDAFLDEAQHNAFAQPVADDAGDGAEPDLPQRPDLDLLDRLWLLLQGAADSDQVAVALARVFLAVETGKLKPFVHKANTSGLARVFHDALRLARLDVGSKDALEIKAALSKAFDHWHDNPIACMLDLGLAKLRRDFAHLFVGADLVSWAMFHAYIGDASEDRMAQVVRLTACHRVLDMLVFAKQAIKALPFEVQSQIVQALLEATANSQAAFGSSPCNELRVSLPRFSSAASVVIAHVAQRLEPCDWSVTWTGGDKSRTLRLSRSDDLFPLALAAGADDDDEDGGLFAVCTVTADTRRI